jgi:hypothetical protein
MTDGRLMVFSPKMLKPDTFSGKTLKFVPRCDLGCRRGNSSETSHRDINRLFVHWYSSELNASGEFDVLHRLKASLWCPKTTLRCLPMASSPMSSPIQGRRDQSPSCLFKNVLSETHALKAAVWTQQRLCVPASGIQIGVPSHTHVDLLSVQDMPEMSLTSR